METVGTAAQCGAERQRERGGGGAGGVGVGGAALWSHAHGRTALRVAYGEGRPVAREAAADWVDDARRRLL